MKTTILKLILSIVLLLLTLWLGVTAAIFRFRLAGARFELTTFRL